jgi:hypothetical protein
MQTIQITLKSGADALLHLQVPLDKPDSEYEVVVQVRPKALGSAAGTPEDRGWPPGFFEDVIGSLEETPLRREDQGIWSRPDDRV